jgi:hypothetical protein
VISVDRSGVIYETVFAACGFALAGATSAKPQAAKT